MDVEQSDSEMGAAKRAAHRAYDAHAKAKKESSRAEAVVAGLTLLELANEYPAMTAFCFEVSSEYDDERYFDVVRIKPSLTDANEHLCEMLDDGEFSEDFDGAWNEEAMELLFEGEHRDRELAWLRGRIDTLKLLKST